MAVHVSREALIELLKEARSDLDAMGHSSPRCDYFGRCVCGLDDLLARIDRATEQEPESERPIIGEGRTTDRIE